MGREKRKDGKNAQYVAVQKYSSKAYDRIAVNVKKGNREKLKDFAESQNMSINGYINKLLAENVPGFIPFEQAES